MGLILVCGVVFALILASPESVASSAVVSGRLNVQAGERGHSDNALVPAQVSNPDSLLSSDWNEAGGTRSKDNNWSGYAITTRDLSVSMVQGKWTVPILTCGGGNSISYIFIGIDGYHSDTVEQIGTDQECRGGVAYYMAWYEMYPAGIVTVKLRVRSGDQVLGTVRYIGQHQFILALENLSTGDSFSTTQSSAGALRLSAEWIVEVPGMQLLANMGTVRITNSQATINGTTGPISSFSDYTLIDMVDWTGPVKAQTFGLSHAGADFAVVWYHR